MAYTLTYFDLSGSRGEDCRLALHAAGVDFEDRRITRSEWVKLKPTTPFGSIPTLESPGKPTLAQSNAILTYIGRSYGLHPIDPWAAAVHEAVMASVEELRAALSPSGRLTEPAAKRAAREALASAEIPAWGASVERYIQRPFLDGDRLCVADIKVYQMVKSFKTGVLDYIEPSVLSAFPKLEGLYDAVAKHPKILEWQTKRA
jgi:prostaglandin-H2 D-isomerase / glutathione transferase